MRNLFLFVAAVTAFAVTDAQACHKCRGHVVVRSSGCGTRGGIATGYYKRGLFGTRFVQTGTAYPSFQGPTPFYGGTPIYGTPVSKPVAAPAAAPAAPVAPAAPPAPAPFGAPPVPFSSPRIPGNEG